MLCAARSRALAADMVSPPVKRWQLLSPLGRKTKMVEIVALPLGGGDGVTNDGGRDRSSTEHHLAPPGRLS